MICNDGWDMRVGDEIKHLTNVWMRGPRASEVATRLHHVTPARRVTPLLPPTPGQVTVVKC